MDIITPVRCSAKNNTRTVHSSSARISHHIKHVRARVARLCHFLLFQANPFVIQLCYFIFTSTVGFLLLMALPTRSGSSSPAGLDLFFMAVSAGTGSSMDSVEMESFSNSQLAVLTLLMLAGGEVFTSMLGLLFTKLRHEERDVANNASLTNRRVGYVARRVGAVDSDHELPDLLEVVVNSDTPVMLENLKLDCIRRLFFVVLTYLLFAHIAGISFVLLYLGLVPRARAVLEAKGIPIQVFAIFTAVSSFSNCGFLPNNENMVAFRSCSGLLLIVAGQVLAGNTLYPWCLWSVLWALKRLTKNQEYDYMLKNHKDVGYDHLIPGLRAACVALTVAAFMALQLVVICCLEWRSEGMSGLSTYQKLVGALFLSVNSRHSGESIVDLSTVSPAVLAMFVVMMYLPSPTRFVPIEEETAPASGDLKHERKKDNIFKKLIVLSPLSCIALFTIAIAITERRQLKEDPLNFNILNIVIEVVSAYGNVGYSTGYSCGRRTAAPAEDKCIDLWTGFSGRWSSEGKIVLILVMLLGRLKKFAMAGGGKAWKLHY